MPEKLFQLKAHNTTVRTEVIAGFTTFPAMAYILFVNPTILSATGMDKGAVFVATCPAAAIGSLLMGLIANYPIALAPGMGLNAFLPIPSCCIWATHGRSRWARYFCRR